MSLKDALLKAGLKSAKTENERQSKYKSDKTKVEKHQEKGIFAKFVNVFSLTLKSLSIETPELMQTGSASTVPTKMKFMINSELLIKAHLQNKVDIKGSTDQQKKLVETNGNQSPQRRRKRKKNLKERNQTLSFSLTMMVKKTSTANSQIPKYDSQVKHKVKNKVQ